MKELASFGNGKGTTWGWKQTTPARNFVILLPMFVAHLRCPQYIPILYAKVPFGSDWNPVQFMKAGLTCLWILIIDFILGMDPCPWHDVQTLQKHVSEELGHGYSLWRTSEAQTIRVQVTGDVRMRQNHIIAADRAFLSVVLLGSWSGDFFYEVNFQVVPQESQDSCSISHP